MAKNDKEQNIYRYRFLIILASGNFPCKPVEKVFKFRKNIHLILVLKVIFYWVSWHCIIRHGTFCDGKTKSSRRLHSNNCMLTCSILIYLPVSYRGDSRIFPISIILNASISYSSICSQFPIYWNNWECNQSFFFTCIISL